MPKIKKKCNRIDTLPPVFLCHILLTPTFTLFKFRIMKKIIFCLLFFMAFMQMKAQSIVIQDKLILLVIPSGTPSVCNKFTINTKEILVGKNNDVFQFTVFNTSGASYSFKFGYRAMNFRIESFDIANLIMTSNHSNTTLRHARLGALFKIQNLNLFGEGFYTFELVPLFNSTQHITDIKRIEITKCYIQTDIRLLPPTNSTNSSNNNAGVLKISPNPTNDKIEVAFNLPETTTATINIYDLNGQLIQIIPNQNYEAGYNTLTLNTSDLLRGVYLVELQTPNERTVQKMVKL